jgi:hypothetical protein
VGKGKEKYGHQLFHSSNPVKFRQESELVKR